MKTAMIARFVLGAGAIFAVAGLAGCGAETGQGAAEGLGQVSSPLVAAGTPGSYSIPAARVFASSCVISDTLTYDDHVQSNHVHNRSLLLVAGGYTGTATKVYHNDWYLVDPTDTGHELVASGTFGTTSSPDDRRAYAKLIAVPNTSGQQCLLVGGENAGGKLARSFLFKLAVSGSTLSPTFAVDGSLTTGRSKLQVAQCAGNHIIAVAGSAAGGPEASIEVYTAGSPGSWTKYSTAGTNALNKARYDFALSANPTVGGGIALALDKFVVFGGNDGSGSPTRSIEAITTNASCVPQTVTQFNTANNQLVVGRDRLAAFPEGVSSNKFIVSGGDNGGAIESSIETATVTWGTPPTLTAIAKTTPTSVTKSLALPFARNPVVTYSGSEFVLIGGEGAVTAADEGGDTVGLMEYIPGTGWKLPADATPANADLANTRVGHVAEYFGGKSYTTAGAQVLTGTVTELSSMEQVTSP